MVEAMTTLVLADHALRHHAVTGGRSSLTIAVTPASSQPQEDPMNYGVVLPIWQLTIAEAESLTVRAEELGPRRRLRPRSHPGQAGHHPALRRHTGPTRSRSWPSWPAARGESSLGASVIVLPYRSALVTAKAAATVDQASGRTLHLRRGRGLGRSRVH